MYIWVVLATFLAILASYTLSPRSDYRKVAVEPVAEAQVAKLVTKHNAAFEYVKFRKYPYTSGRRQLDYDTGIIPDDEITPYLPYGHENDENFTSQIFCMDEFMEVAYDSVGSADNPCADRHNKRRLITYGPIPERWLNQLSGLDRPNTDYMNAVRNTVDEGEMLGYTANGDSSVSNDNPSGSAVMIVDRMGSKMYYIPKAIVNDPDFKSVCDLTKNKVCLVYMSGI